MLRRETEQALIETIAPLSSIRHCAIEEVGVDMLADASVDAIILIPPTPFTGAWPLEAAE